MKIIWTEIAQEDRKSIFEHWNEINGNRKYSNRLNTQINKKLNLLSHFPEIGSNSNYYKTKFISLNPYLIFYKIQQNEIVVLRIWDGRRNPISLKF